MSPNTSIIIKSIKLQFILQIHKLHRLNIYSYIHAHLAYFIKISILKTISVRLAENAVGQVLAFTTL